jgi:hypothetical protein
MRTSPATPRCLDGNAGFSKLNDFRSIMNFLGFIRPVVLVGLLVAAALSLVLGLALPLAIGVWLPDVFSGKQHTLCSATSATGHRISIVHYWNHVDFYTTEARVTSPDEITSTTLIDGDASKTWGATLEIDPSQKGATYTLPDGRIGNIIW